MYQYRGRALCHLHHVTLQHNTDLEVVEDGYLEEGLLAIRHLALPVHVPRGCHDRSQIWPPSQDLIVHCHGAAPTAEAS